MNNSENLVVAFFRCDNAEFPPAIFLVLFLFCSRLSNRKIKKLGLTRRQQATKCFVGKELLAKAKCSDTSALFYTGIAALINSKVGFAERSFYAARGGHPKAERVASLLKHCEMVSKWRDTVLYLFNNSIL